MKLKIVIIIALVASLASQAQTKIDKTIPIRAGQKLTLMLDDPELKLQTWDKNEVSIKGTVSINRGENDSAFELQIDSSPQSITVTSALKDRDNIPHRIIIKKGDREYYFKARDYNDPEVQKFLDENGGEYSYMSNGIVKEIKLEVFVPKNIETIVAAKYGLVEVMNFEAPLAIDAKYGGVDVTLTEAATGQITARCRHGEILTNLNIKFDESRSTDRHEKWTEITAKPGKGPRYDFESKYGNVYLRKGN